MTVDLLECRRQLAGIFQAAVAAVEPSHLVRDCVSSDRGWVSIHGAGSERARWRGPTLVVGAGKAAGRMAAGCEAALPRGDVTGLVITADGYDVPLRDIECVSAGHPLPDSRGLVATEKLCDLVSTSNVPVVVVLSGGASSLLVRPQPDVTLNDKVTVNRLLLASGADIECINRVRKHLSQIKGGGLLRLTSRRPLVTLILSDVIGDDPAVVGSGPTVPDPSTYADAIDVLRDFRLEKNTPPSVQRWLTRGQRGEVLETVKPGDEATAGVINLIVGSNRIALDAAATEAARLGYRVLLAPEPLSGPTVTAAAGWLSHLARAEGDSTDALCLLAGGETTVRVKGKGRGGRNQEFALALVRALANRRVVALSAGTDGIDGPTDAAGAFVDGTSLARAKHLSLNAETRLEDNDSYTFFAQLGDLFHSGPTGTNVMDIKIALRPGF